MEEVGDKDQKAEMKENPVKKSNLTEKIRGNPWSVSTFILGILVVILLITTFSGGFTGNVTSTNNAGNKVVSFLNKYLTLDNGITLKSVEENPEAGVYIIKVNYKNSTIPTYLSYDGKYIDWGIGMINIDSYIKYINSKQIDSSSSTTQQEVPKTDKPSVELYIFSYCPAGTAALDSFAKMGALLKNVADIKVKFFSNMHGEHEKQQNMIQECIQDVAKDKYWDYANQYVSKVYNKCGATRDVQCDKTESINLMKSIGIDSDAVMNCVTSKGNTLYQEDQQDANELGLQYSPSVIINGVYLPNVNRTPEGLKSAVCSAFKEVPTQCSQKLSSSTTTASGNC